MSSDEFKQSAYAQETDSTVISLLTLSAEGEGESVKVCDDPYEKLVGLGEDVYGCISNGETFIFAPFELTLPRDDKTGTVSARLTIENVTREIVEYARSIIKPIDVKTQVVLSSAVDVVEFEFDGFKLGNVNHDGFKISGNLTLDYWSLEPYPSGRFTPSGFPGLF